MDAKFDKIHKILSRIDQNTSQFLEQKGNDIKDVNIFNEDGSLKKELLTKDGFINGIFENVNGKNFEHYENLYNTIANIDDNPEMSEEELKFIASYANDDKDNLINKEDFYEMGLIDRNMDSI